MESATNLNFNSWVKAHGISGSMLKMIAFVAMFIDHAAILLFPQASIYKFLRIIGRLAFPIFCFLVSEGLVHSKDKLRYLLRMLLFGFICQFPHALAFEGADIFIKLNIYFTFVFAILPVVMFLSVTRFSQRKFSANVSRAIGGLAFLLCLIFVWQVSKFIRIEYGIFGVGLTIVFYVSKFIKPFDLLITGAYMLYIWRGNPVQLYGALCIPLLLLYNGERGFINTSARKILCYAFYPAHILLLYAISLLIK